MAVIVMGYIVMAVGLQDRVLPPVGSPRSPRAATADPPAPSTHGRSKLVVHVYTHAYIHVSTHVYVHVCAHFHTHVYIRVHTHIYTHV